MGVEGYDENHASSSADGQSEPSLEGSYEYPNSPPRSQYSRPRNARQQTSTKKRKLNASGSSPLSDQQDNFVDLTQDSPPKKRKTSAKTSPALGTKGDEGTKSKKRASKPKDEEKRLRRWRSHAPTSYLEIRERALTQRMFVLDRKRNTEDGYPIETVSLAGTTGNIYTITIDKVPSCDCPYASKGHYCKHVAYVLSRVLRAPAHLQYQLAFITSEMHEIFANAPPLPSEVAEQGDEHDGNRKPVEGECPICCVDFEPDSGEKVIYCKAACGNNVHADCFQQWAATKKAHSSAVTCPFCRTTWQSNTDAELASGAVPKDGPRNAEGYVNIATQLGLSGRRDYSSYHSYWVRRQAASGSISWDDDGVMHHDRY